MEKAHSNIPMLGYVNYINEIFNTIIPTVVSLMVIVLINIHILGFGTITLMKYYGLIPKVVSLMVIL